MAGTALERGNGWSTRSSGSLFDQARTTLTSSADLQRFTAYQSAFNEVVERFNLLSLLGRLQTFPVGISSLLAKTMPVRNPFGSQNVVRSLPLPVCLGWAFLLTVIGWVAEACTSAGYRESLWVSERER